MLPMDPDSLLQEIRDAEELRKRVLTNTVQLVRRYVGNWYRTDSRQAARPENMLFSYVATMLPELVYSNPTVAVKAKRSISHKAIARFMQMGLNGWIEETEVKDELEALAVDLLFGFGVCKVGLEPRGDFNSATKAGVMEHFSMDALHPYAIRLSPANTIIDAQAVGGPKRARLLGHQFQRDLTSLQGDERYDQAVVAQLTADDQARIGKAEQSMPDKTGRGATRGRVTLYELYFPENRTIGTLSLNANGNAMWIRPPVAYHGPKEGPYVFFGVYLVPEQVYPLSPVAAIAEQDQELNAHARAAAKEAAGAKSGVAVNADNAELAQSIENMPINGVIKVKGLNANSLIPFATGGTSQQRMEYLAMLLQRCDRVGGQSEAARGKAQGVTATEAQIAHTNADGRTEFIVLKYQDGVAEVMQRVGWFFYHDPAVVTYVNWQDPTSGAEDEGVFLGGVQEGQEGSDWTQFNLQIDPMSMRRMDPQQQQQQATQVVGLALQIAPLIPQMPYVNWSELLDMIGEAANLPDFAQRVLNAQGLALIQAGMMPGVMPGAGPAAQMTMGQGSSPGVQGAAAGAPVGAMPRIPTSGGGVGAPGAAGAGSRPSAGAANPAVAGGGRMAA